MVKLKHNKKRNTAFLYEALVREITKSVVAKNLSKKEAIIETIKVYFKPGSALRDELLCYKNLTETTVLRTGSAERLLQTVKEKHSKINKRRLFNEQTKLINHVNKSIDKDVFSNFVPNYKSLATLYQIFNVKTPLNTKVVLEENIVTRLTRTRDQKKETLMKPVDDLVFNTFVKKFNEEYSTGLLEEQRGLLNKYVLSFMDNGLELKLYLNEEVGRLKTALQNALETKEVREDQDMNEKTRQVIDLLESFKGAPIDEAMVKRVLRIQNLVKEIND